jgi:hypothetical protein
MRILIAAALVAVVASLEIPDGYMIVPGGMMLHKSCVHQVPNGFLVDENFDRPCPYPAKLAPNDQIYAIDVHYTKPSGIVNNMNASFTTPGLPTQRNRGQVVYFWPGFKSTVPTMGYPVLQPVLQYGTDSEGGGDYWCVRSWFVWGQQGQAVVSPEVAVSPSDLLTSYMVYNTATQQWAVSATNTKTGKPTTLNISKQKAGNTDYKVAMLVLETIMPPNQCGQFPGAPAVVTFTDVKLDGAPVDWTERVPRTDCKQRIKRDANSVNFAWN